MARSLYYGRQKTEQLLSEAHRCINEVVLSAVPANQSPPHAFQHPEQQLPQPNPQTGLGMQGATQLPVNTSQSTYIPGLDEHRVQTSQTEWQPQSQFQPEAQEPQNTYPHLPVPQGLGTGQFLEQHSPPQSFDFGQQLYAAQSAQPYSPHHPIEEPAAPPPRSVDDFGINTNSYGQMDSPGLDAGGRFATFPAKNRSYNLTDPQAPAGQESESFSASVAQALSPSHDSPGTLPPPRLAYELSPAQRSPQLQQRHSLETPVQGDPSGRLSLHHEARGTYHDDEAGLAYDDPYDDHASRRDRLVTVQEVDPRLETRSGRSNGDVTHNTERQVNESQDYHQPASPLSPEGQPPEYEAIPPVAEVVSESRASIIFSHNMVIND